MLAGDAPARRSANDSMAHSSRSGSGSEWRDAGGPLARINPDDGLAAVWAYYGTFSVVAPSHRIEPALLPVLLPDVREPSVWRDLIAQYDDWSVPTMMRIARCESNFDENVTSPDGQNVGLFQINLVHGWSADDLRDPAFNIAAAHDVWLSQSYEAWACF